MLQFDFRRRPLSFPAVEEERRLSPFTGRSLRTLRTVIALGSPLTLSWSKNYSVSLQLKTLEGGLWSGVLTSESYSEDGPHELEITWSEAERLQADRVEFEGLVLTPTQMKRMPMRTARLPSHCGQRCRVRKRRRCGG